MRHIKDLPSCGFFMCIVLLHIYKTPLFCEIFFSAHIFSDAKQVVIENGLQRELLPCRMDSPADVLFFILFPIHSSAGVVALNIEIGGIIRSIDRNKDFLFLFFKK